MATETLKTSRGWNAIFGERLLKQCGILPNRAGIWTWKKAPEPPEIPVHHDAEMEDAPAGLDDDDDDDGVAEVDVRQTRPTRSRRPPAPPEGGWTLDHVMASIYDLTTDFRGYRQSTSKWRNQMDTKVAQLDTRVTRLEGLVGEGAHTQEEEDDDNGDDTQSDDENGDDTQSD
ncbi:uncharacterized protein LOC133291431 [Gastrolobium bilobum]|uniref:uncharacterized protein LOC133291431 n=1 Tax=Gastrolobium bilobum TaxID=150636 RepID=UPI002AB2F600|nr:uncharacterized protein LOC133291431 [Gastrolobium bilobum]